VTKRLTLQQRGRFLAGRTDEYTSFYKYGSYFVHGSLTDAQVYGRDSVAHLYPIRDVRYFPTVVSNVALLMLQSNDLVVQDLPPGELDVLRERQLRPWAEAIRDIVSVKIDVNMEPVRL
jgi:hypothetical protein